MQRNSKNLYLKISAKVKLMKHKILFILLFLFSYSIVSSQCEIQDTLIPIPDDETPLVLQILVSGIANNDLSNSNQGVCAVFLHYEHQQRMDLTIDLISPIGQSVNLVGPRQPFFKPLTGNIEWDISFVRSGDAAAPDLGNDAIFDNTDISWGFGSTYTGVYYPHKGNLEDFNKGPANGLWTLVVFDHDHIYKGNFLGLTIEFCDGSTMNCDLCQADAGDFGVDTLTFCETDPDIYFELNPQYNGSEIPDPQKYGYQYIVSRNNSLVEITTKPDTISFKQGFYHICGVSYYKDDSSFIFDASNNLSLNDFIDSIETIGTAFCADITDTCTVIEIKQVQHKIFIDTLVCQGDTIDFRGHKLYDPGEYFFTDNNACDTTFSIHLENIVLNADISAQMTELSCDDGGMIELKGLGFEEGKGMNFKWNRPLPQKIGDTTTVLVGQPGDYYFVLSQGGCSDTAKITITSQSDFPVLQFDIQNIDCTHDSARLSVVSVNTPVDSIIWINSNNEYLRGNDIITTTTGYYLVNVYAPGGCFTMDVVNVLNDTIPPAFITNGTDITCDMDTAHIWIESGDMISSVLWKETSSTSYESFVVNPGIYHVTVVGTNTCIATDSIRVNEYKTPISYSINYDTLSCDRDTILIDFETQDTLNSIKWVTPAGDTIYTEDIYATGTGNYYCYFEDKNGCSIKDTAKIIRDISTPELTIATPELYISCGIDSVQLSFNSSSYLRDVEWIGPGNFYSSEYSPYVHFLGIYTVTVTGSNGCTTIGQIEVKADTTVPDIMILTDTINCLDDTANISVSYSGNYRFDWVDPAGNSLTGDNINEPYDGYYYLTVYDLDNNCKNEFFAYVPIDTVIPDIDIEVSNELDCISNTAKLNIHSNITLNEVSWKGHGFQDFGDTVVVSNPGTYYVRVTSSGFCEAYDSIEVINTGFVGVSSDTFYLNCVNEQQVRLILSGIPDSLDFNWEGPSFSSHEAYPVVNTEGIYSVTVTDGICTDSADILVQMDTIGPVADIEYDAEINCSPPYSILKATLYSNYIDTFYWEGPGNYFSSNLIDTVYSEGQYSFTVTGINGCSSLYIFDILKSDDFTDIKAIGDTINCDKGVHDLTISAQISGSYLSLQWEGPNGYKSSLKNNTVIDTGKYFLYVINELGCLSVDSTMVIDDVSLPQYNISAPEVITCYNDSVQIAVNSLDSNAVYTYSWQGPNGFYSDKQSFYAKRGGDYLVEVKGDNGCSLFDTISVEINKLHPYVYLEANDLTCYSSVSEINLYTNVDNYSVKWTGTDTFNMTRANPRVQNEGMYYVEVTDTDNGCSTEDSINILSDKAKPEIFVDDFYLPCDTSKVELKARSSDLNSIFVWSGPNNFYVENEFAYTNEPGQYQVRVIPSNGCDTFAYFNVYDIPVAPEFEAYGTDISCLSDSAKLKAVGVEDDLSFQWTGPGGFMSNEKEPFVSEEGDYTLYVIGQNKCDSSITVSVSLDTLRPDLQIEYSDSIICEKQTATLHLKFLNGSSDMYSIIWTSENGEITFGQYTDSPIVQGEGKYKVKVQNNTSGCFVFDSIIISSSEYNLDSVNIEIVPPTCYGYSDGVFIVDSIFGGHSPYKFSLDNYWFSNNNEFSSKEAGVYNIYIKDKFGCFLDTVIVMPDGAGVQLKLTSDKKEVYPGESVELKANILSDYTIKEFKWKPEDLFETQDTAIQVIKPTESGEISLEVYDENGCYDEDAVWINVLSKPELYLPNIFSPNYDNINDYFYVKVGRGVKSIKNLSIYDRWGEKIFEKNDMELNVPTEGWDGKFKGKEAAQGVYVYFIELELENGELEKISGDLTLIR